MSIYHRAWPTTFSSPPSFPFIPGEIIPSRRGGSSRRCGLGGQKNDSLQAGCKGGEHYKTTAMTDYNKGDQITNPGPASGFASDVVCTCSNLSITKRKDHAAYTWVVTISTMPHVTHHFRHPRDLLALRPPAWAHATSHFAPGSVHRYRQRCC